MRACPDRSSSASRFPATIVTEISVVRYGRSETLTTFTSAAATGEAFVTLTVQVILWPRSAVVGRAVFTIARSTSSPGGGVGVSGGGSGCVGGLGGWGRSGGRGVGGVVMRRLVKVQTTKSPFATAPSTFVPVTDTSWMPFRVQVDGRFVVGQVRARACGLADRPLPDADRVGTGRGPVAAAREHLPVQQQVEDAGVVGRRGDLPQLEDRRTARRRTRRGHGLAPKGPGQRAGVAERGLEGARPASRLEQLRLAAVGGRGRELVRRADRDLNREVVVVAIAPDRLLGSARLGRRRTRAPAPAASTRTCECS